MGIIIGQDYEPGNFCIHCWGPAFEIALGPGFLISPKYIRVTFSGVIACSPGATPDGEWILTQTPIPCYWVYTDANWRIEYYAFDSIGPTDFSTLGAFYLPMSRRAFVADGNPCSFIFNNFNGPTACAGGDAGHSGTGVITWGPGIEP